MKFMKVSNPFSQIGNLALHRKVVHEGIKDHKCGSCGKSFSFGHHLKSHFKTVHEGLKEFNCE